MRKLSLFLVLFCMMFLCACQNLNSSNKSNVETEDNFSDTVAEINENDVYEKGYDLPVDEKAGKLAEEECEEIMGKIEEVYKKADKGIASNVVLSDETILQMKEIIKATGNPITSPEPYAVMENYKKLEDFLYACMNGEKGSAVIYELNYSGGVSRKEYIFDGTDLYLLAAGGIWNRNNQPSISYLSYTRIKQWEYTEKGWFCYELCVPEYPEVTEMVDGSCLIRVRPMTEEQRAMSVRCVLELGYQGNNLLCSNWDATHMEELDFNGMYEYLYAMKYGKTFNAEDYPNGIPRDVFENLIMEYLPITEGQIREYGVFDEESQTYPWTRLGCTNYSPTYFGTSLPEVIGIRENEDGTVTLTVEAVCEMVVCDDAVITHELTVRFLEDGSFQYLGNRILKDGIENIPDYQYRISKE